MPILKWLFGQPSNTAETDGQNAAPQIPELDTQSSDNQQASFTLTIDDLPYDFDKIGRVRDIDEMEARKHDLEYQYALIRPMMQKGDILPYPFHRVVILLTKEKRFQEALDVCNYVNEWCETARREYDGSSAMHWKSPELENMIGRIPKLQSNL